MTLVEVNIYDIAQVYRYKQSGYLQIATHYSLLKKKDFIVVLIVAFCKSNKKLCQE